MGAPNCQPLFLHSPCRDKERPPCTTKSSAYRSHLCHTILKASRPVTDSHGVPSAISCRMRSCSSWRTQNVVSVSVPVCENAIALQPALQTEACGQPEHRPVSSDDLLRKRGNDFGSRQISTSERLRRLPSTNASPNERHGSRSPFARMPMMRVPAAQPPQYEQRVLSFGAIGK